jgi:multidrug efflux pump subunit AcrB
MGSAGTQDQAVARGPDHRLFNQEDEALPIVLRVKQDEVPGADIAALRGVQIRPANSADTVPLDQVIDGVAPRWEDPIIWRRDRKRTITLQANPIRGVTLTQPPGSGPW